MYNVNETIMYGSLGVCTVTAIEEKTIGKQKALYYCLTTLDNEKCAVFCPVEGCKVPMRHLMTREQVFNLIADIDQVDDSWISNEMQRKAYFEQVFQRGEPVEIARLTKSLHAHQKEQQAQGRKFHISDERWLERAERILHGEIAFVLQIPREDVPSLIAKEIKNK